MTNDKKKPQTFRDDLARMKRDGIIEAAAELFHRDGYAATTLDAVAERMGFSKAFIYANFASKQDLLLAVCDRGVTEVHKAVAGVLDLGLDTRTTLALVVDRYVSAVLEQQKFIAVYTREDKSLGPTEAVDMNAKRRAFFAMLATFIEKGRDKGVFKTPDPLLSALTLGGAVTWMAFWYRDGGRLDPRDIASQVTRSTLMMLGVATED